MSLNFICDTAIFQGVCLAPATQVSRTAKPIFMGGELFPHANYTLEMINDMIQEIEICPDGDIIPKNLNARYKLPRMDYFKIFFKKNGYRKDITVAKELLKLYVQSPCHIVNRAQNVQTSGDLLVLAKNLSFHKNLPTLDQISTIPNDLSQYTQVADASGNVQVTQNLSKKKGNILWVIYDKTTNYKSIVKKAIKRLMEIDKQNKIDYLLFPDLRKCNYKPVMAPAKYGLLGDTEGKKYVAQLYINDLISKPRYNRVYVMLIQEGTSGVPSYDSDTFKRGIVPLGYGIDWRVTIWPKRIKEIYLRFKEEGYSTEGSLDNWLFVALMHEILHAVGVRHLFEVTPLNDNSKNLKKFPYSVMRPYGSKYWLKNIYKIEPETKKAFMEGFGL